jgi:quercetin dioxygenase-like cupin family protein
MNSKRLVGAGAAALVSISLISISLNAATPADAPLPMLRFTASEIGSMAAAAPKGANPAIQMTNLVGDPSKPGLYTVRVALAPHTQAKPHVHRDNRSVTVVSGTWSMGYGAQFDEKALKALPPGSVYTEPAGQAHFSQAGNEPVVILVTGYGPSDTKFVTN